MMNKKKPMYQFGDEGSYGDSLGSDSVPEGLDYPNQLDVYTGRRQVGSNPTPSTPAPGFPSTGGGFDSGSFTPSMTPATPAAPSNNIGMEWLSKIFDSSTGGTINEFNKSANRLRERLDSSGQGAMKRMTDSNIGRGFGNSGFQERSMYQNNADTQNAYAQGLNQLSNDFEKNRLSGLGIGLGAAQSQIGNTQFYDKMGNENVQNDFERQLRKYIADAGNKTSLQVGKLGAGSSDFKTFIENFFRGAGL